MGILEGKVAIVTGAGRGVGRGEALELAAPGRQGRRQRSRRLARRRGRRQGAGRRGRRDHQGAGGEAVANYDDVADWDGAEHLVDQAIDTFGGARHRREQRRHPARRIDREHDRGRLRLGDPRAPQGHVRHDPPRRRLLAGASRRTAQAQRPPSSTPSSARACRATPARPTTARRRPASPRSPSSPRSRAAATACGPTRSRPAAPPGWSTRPCPTSR